VREWSRLVTGGDVIDSLLAARTVSRDENDSAIRFWGELIRRHKPRREWMPLSPAEEAAIRGELEVVARTVRVLLNALADARARRPAHFRLVQEGGR
jgi:hypothetical protein